jgi:aspartyl-tRNA(Asn)/glutamyl-tRNA(Gln) amidotransferase subunit C
MILPLETIKHLAELARLSLTRSETKRYSRELGAVLEHVGQLSQVDISQLPPTESDKLKNVWRLDEASLWPESELKLALDQAGDREAEGLKVRRILA